MQRSCGTARTRSKPRISVTLRVSTRHAHGSLTDFTFWSANIAQCDYLSEYDQTLQVILSEGCRKSWLKQGDWWSEYHDAGTKFVAYDAGGKTVLKDFPFSIGQRGTYEIRIALCLTYSNHDSIAIISWRASS